MANSPCYPSRQMPEQSGNNHRQVLVLALMLVTCALTISACSDPTPPTSEKMSTDDAWSSQEEALFQEAAALRHTLEELKLQEQWQQELQEQPAER